LGIDHGPLARQGRPNQRFIVVDQCPLDCAGQQWGSLQLFEGAFGLGKCVRYPDSITA